MRPKALSGIETMSLSIVGPPLLIIKLRFPIKIQYI